VIGHLFAVDAEKIKPVCICLRHVAEGRNGTCVALPIDGKRPLHRWPITTGQPIND